MFIIKNHEFWYFLCILLIKYGLSIWYSIGLVMGLWTLRMRSVLSHLRATGTLFVWSELTWLLRYWASLVLFYFWGI